MMHDDLYFIPLIAQALEQPNCRGALCETFERITTMGRQPRYAVGYRQFLIWMDVVKKSMSHEIHEVTADSMLELTNRPASVELRLERDGAAVASCTFERARGVKTVGDITPGHYTLKLETGRTVWEGELAARDVLHRPEEPMKMVADTGEAPPPTREFTELDGMLIVRVFAGMEVGVVEIELTDREVEG